MTIKAAGPFYTDLAQGLSSDVANGFTWAPVVDGVQMGAIHTATVTDTQPVTENPVVVSAVKALSPNDTFYNRIIIDPSELALGNLLSSQSRAVRVWNGFLTSKSLTQFQGNNDDGIEVAQPVALPYTMLPLEELTYVFNVSLDGPANINADFQWTIDGIDYQLGVTGSRVVVFPFGPNWKLDKLTETLDWLTDVLRAFSGKEQRISLRTKARRSFSYTMSVAREQSSYFENLLWGWQNRIYAMPVWSDKSHLVGEHQAGDMTLSLDASTFSFSAGSLAVLFNGYRDFEVVEVETVAPTGIRLVRPLQNPYSDGQVVMPMVLGHLPTQVSQQRLTSGALTASIVFTTEPSVTDPYTPVGAVPTPYLGLDVITRQPNWKGGLSITSDYQFNAIDGGTGKIVWDATEKHPSVIRQYSWLLTDRAKVKTFRELLGRLRGKAKTCWIPTWHDDFRVNKVIGAADISIQVDDNGFRTLIGNDPSRNHLMLRLNDGRLFFRQIIGLSTDGVSTQLSIDSAFGFQIEVADIHSLYLLMRNRLATDTVEIVWQSTEVATIDTSFTTVIE
jgi:hypothetical protein